ncbi:uncharacterized protein SPAPADRAFT_63731 [Spathaspora passalidarum NRRL Y-27907]|uniref:DNL-type domain-containing protein n=1 Tax=Spathaspora passalidarum (strain NRRL Y-27907 / 11-Y1) TaxID=619300 RepID=G3AV37_SPAPN|nr:uncharacterized protein SPAPADRAFT_63731 [Spathaspora passalidarum NRRL Y-27907]EGW30111.1 hypothetical protein SPAPADRAFT_63731 [Spathaspora passalidarum NRRL Y-27907]
MLARFATRAVRVAVPQVTRSVRIGSSIALTRRWYTDKPSTPHATPTTTTQQTRGNTETAAEQEPKGEYLIQFTCNPCSTRSTHTFSKLAYHHGTVLIQCPSCKNRHLIADNLGFARDGRINIEQLLAAQGESVGKEKGDLVFEDVPESMRDKLNNVVTGIKVKEPEV